MTVVGIRLGYKIMTIEEFDVIAKGMRAMFPKEHLFPDTESVGIWYSMLGDLDYKDCMMAIQRHATESDWSPSIAGIRNMVVKNRCEEPADAGEAWEVAKDLVRRYGYGRWQEAKYDMLNEDSAINAPIIEAVERFGWKDLCDMDPEQVMACRAQFMKIYSSIADRKREMLAMPLQLSKQIEMQQMEREIARLPEQNVRLYGREDIERDGEDRRARVEYQRQKLIAQVERLGVNDDQQ